MRCSDRCAQTCALSVLALPVAAAAAAAAAISARLNCAASSCAVSSRICSERAGVSSVCPVPMQLRQGRAHLRACLRVPRFFLPELLFRAACGERTHAAST